MLMLPLASVGLGAQADSTVELLGVQTDSLLGTQADSIAELLGTQTDTLLGAQTDSTAGLLGAHTDATGVEEGRRLEGVHQVLV
jgi:hypothetical protein